MCGIFGVVKGNKKKIRLNVAPKATVSSGEVNQDGIVIVNESEN